VPLIPTNMSQLGMTMCDAEHFVDYLQIWFLALGGCILINLWSFDPSSPSATRVAFSNFSVHSHPLIMPDQDASNRHRGRKATRFACSDEQREVIDLYIPAFEKAVRDLNPGLSKSNNNLSKWKTATAETIMDHDLFQDIEENSSETRKKWFAVSTHRSSPSLIAKT